MAHARSFFWSFVNSIGTKGLSFVIFAAMGRLLTPTDFGVVAMAMVVCAIVDVIADLGLTESLVQKGDRSARLLSACLFMQGGAAVLASLIAYGVGWVLPLGESSAGFIRVLPWMLLASVFNALSAAALAELRLSMDFMNMAKRNFVGTLVGGVVGIWAAAGGHGAISLGWMTAANAFTGLVVALALCDFHIQPRADFGAAVRMLAFSRSIMGARLVEVIFSRLDQFFIGAAFGAHGLGVYAFAYRLYDILLTVTVAPIGEVLLSTMSRLKDQLDEMARSYLRNIEMCAALVSPVFLVAGVGANYWVPLAFGEHWSDAIPFVQLLLGVGAIQGPAFNNGIAMTTSGHPHYRFKLALASAALWAVVFFPGIQLGAPPLFAAWTTVIRWVVIVGLQFWIVCRILGIRPKQLYLSLKKPILGMGVAIATLGLWGAALPHAPAAANLAVMALSLFLHIAVLVGTKCESIKPIEQLFMQKLVHKLRR